MRRAASAARFEAWSAAAAIALSLSLLPRAALAGDADKPSDDASGASDDGEGKAEKKPADSGEEAKKPEEKERGEDDPYGHGMQFGLRGGVMLGFKMDFRYQHSPLCKDPATDPQSNPDQHIKTCGYAAPPAADVALSFAPLDSVEPYVFGRFGLSGEAQSDTNALVLFGVGARLYTMSDSRFKIFFEPAVAYEVESGAGSPNYNPPDFPFDYKKDLIFHIGIGPQYDFSKGFGLYANTGFDVGVFRSISAVLLLNIGVQIRMP